MRRAVRLAVTALVIAALPAGALPTAALAKGEPMGVRMDSEVKDLRAGRAIDVTFTVLARPAAQHWRDPAVWISSPGAAEPAQYFAARSTGRTGQYTAHVTFPTAGQWTYTVGERYGRFFDFPPVDVASAPRHGRSSLLGATPLAALGVLGALGCATLVRRRRTAG